MSMHGRFGKQPSMGRRPFGSCLTWQIPREMPFMASRKRGIYQPMYWPPLIARFAPVIQRAWSFAKKPTA